jgi:4-amino-4-deoxy-L-arabinose transferase-like glycosyltransferase
MILLLLLSILLPQLTAVILIWIVWPVQKLTTYDFLLKFCFAVGIGFGILSCVFFLQLSLFGPSRTGLVSTQIALLIVLVAILFYRTKGAKKSQPVPGDSERPLKASRFALTLSGLFLVALVSAACAFVFISLRQPHGEWDAWAVYNMKARFFFRGGEYWRDIFSEPTGWTSPDYPLLLPATIAACWTLISRDTVAVPVLVAFLFTFATVGMVTGCVSILRGRSQGALAGLVLVCTPFFIKHGANQYTDIPLAFFFTATIILIHLKDKFPDGERRFLLLAGMMTGFSAWTKNEGLLFLVAILVSRFVVVVPKDGLKPYLRQMRFFAVGLIPVLLVIIYFKATLATANRMLFPPQGPRLVEKLLDSSRYLTIVDAFVREALGLGNWAASIIPLLLFYLLLFGVSIKQEEKRSIVASLLVLGIMLVGYFAAFVLSPLDVSLHLSTSLNRVSLHLWPSLVVIFFLIVRTPEQALAKADVVSLPA